MPDKRRIVWIDAAKMIAIVAVVIDHMCTIVYNNYELANTFYFSVSLFVILSGISSYLTINSERYTGYGFQLRRIGKLVLQYAVATLILQCVYKRDFRLERYVDNLLHFNASNVFYYFLFFFQLLLIAPALVRWCKFCNLQKRAWLWQGATIAFLCVFAWWSINYTYMLPVWGGGQYLFGGTYIILFYLGMLLMSRDVFSGTKKQRRIILAAASVAWIVWQQLLNRDLLPFDRYLMPFWGDGGNPPSVIFMVFAVITLFLLYAGFSLLAEAKRPVARRAVGWIAAGGRYTLYVFMYHLLAGDEMLKLFPSLVNNSLLSWLIVFLSMILLPILGIKLVRWVYGRVMACVAAGEVRE